jgi:hypothetical protein
MSRKRTTSPANQRLPFASVPAGASREYEPLTPGPNPKLPEFIAKHATPYNPKTDTYDVPAFDRDLVIDKATPPKAIYDMHTYWSKKHWAAIREYIRHTSRRSTTRAAPAWCSTASRVRA